MVDGRHARGKRLFLAACERPRADRSVFLERSCKDEDLRREVESVLQHHRDPPATDAYGLSLLFAAAPPAAHPAGAPPASIGDYRLVRKLGEGGMGEVWAAEQQAPVQRRVALKRIKWGMDTGEVLARFESERQALALMSHQAIASIYDAGATRDGRPYFVMEYVSGMPVTEYCDTWRLTVGERLELFIEICRGIQHAHRKGIIHRDVKPSNVLVTVEDGKPVPKIIDFGVAKATAQRLTERTLCTELGQWIGTPEYMSPEQAEMNGLDVDTRTDVYSLGALLYELLAGTQPFPAEELRRVGFDEMRRRIREEEPARPSTRVSLDTARQVAKQRRNELPILARELRGDLDRIAMKALEKDRSRRYGSPAELAADLRRHLDHQPVSATTPSVLYRVGKFIRRHRTGVTVAAVAVAAHLIGAAAATISLVRARREADPSEAHEDRCHLGDGTGRCRSRRSSLSNHQGHVPPSAAATFGHRLGGPKQRPSGLPTLQRYP